MVGTTGNEYKVWYNYGNKGRGQRVYRCITHRECGKLFRVAFAEDGVGEVTTLEETGEHAEILSGETKTGINLRLKRESDDLLVGGAGGQKCRKLLSKRQSRVPIPSEKQLNNRKAYLKKKQSGGWKIGDNAKLLEWVAGKRCETTDSFFGVGLSFDPVADATSFASHTHSFQHDLIVLKAFEYTTEEESGTKVSSYGIIATSRACFRNVVYAVRGQGDDGVLGDTDGTYELHFGGWTLIDFENMLVYKEMFSTVKHFASKFFGITLQLAFGSLDHTSYIANAFKAEWPDILLLDCYAHFVRKARAKTKLLQNDKFFDTDVWPDIKYLHEARSKEQFIALGETFLQYWITKREGVYSKWLQDYYLTGCWANWYGTCAIPGITPSQNALESHHRVIKKSCVAGLRGSTATVLNESLPSVLFHQSTVPVRLTQAHFCEGPLLSEIITKSKLLLGSSENYYSLCITKRKVLKSILFNASKYVVDGRNVHGNKVTRDRVHRFLNSVRGDLQPTPTVHEVELLFLSLHKVELLHLKGHWA
ncbi:hypothetical protein PR003_g510 [Phytophthora rubi]|uniref:Uncharacterized protein n=1 Tax=Phytophthora rubi TaxID=129364 RepID=A0A6A4FYA0_9STRA|nr:hypothetical protein PR003_g510 [Phytophthora rubi]